MDWRIRPAEGLAGSTGVPGDKSLSHRALIMGMLADGVTRVRGWLNAGDTLATLGAVEDLGIKVERQGDSKAPLMGWNLAIHGGNPHSPEGALDFANAGTGIRLMTGALVGAKIDAVLDGSEQLRRRPMKRITEPLQMMGADVADTVGCAPLTVRAKDIHGMSWGMPVASAQVKSCILLAALGANTPTVLYEPGPCRDHTERMLAKMGANIEVAGHQITLTPSDVPLKPLDMIVPGDFSSAAFLIVAGLIVPGSAITLTNVGLNPTRPGLLDILASMGAGVVVEPGEEQGGEPIGTLRVDYAVMRGAEVHGEVIGRAIDEFPALMVAATQAEGTMDVHDAAELRVKETDRIAVMAAELRKMGAEIEERPDGFIIEGPQSLHGARVNAHDDHRIAMSLAVAGLIAEGETVVEGADAAADSFPAFAAIFRSLGADMVQAS